LVKGFEIGDDQYVVVEEQEIRNLAPPKSTEMQIVEFVHFSEIDPVYLETSYYLTPDGDAEKSYALLLEAMRTTGYAAIGQLTMHRRDHVMIVRPGRTGLIAHTMFYPDEVRSIEEFRTDTSLVVPKELDLAKSLIQVLAKPFEPAQFKNSFRERLQQLIESRIEGQQISHVEQPSRPSAAKVVDIMEALKRSLEQLAPRKPARVEQTEKRRKQAKG
jgi:DNA end-binding protein Ku